MNKLVVLEIKSSIGGINRSLFPVVICEDKEMVLVDAGYAGQFDLFKSAAIEKGIDLENLTKIVITHQDIDHISGLAEMKRRFKNVQVMSSEIEADYISGKKKSLRLVWAENNIDKMSDDQKVNLIRLKRMIEGVESTNVDVLLKDNEILPGCHGIRVIATPGHLPGHISVYFEATKTMITGDAVGIVDGKFVINPMFTLDKDQAKEYIKKMLTFDIKNIVCYHGGVFEGNCREALSAVLD